MLLQRALTSLTLLASLAAQPARKPLDAVESDPVRMGWMQGFPPPPDKLVKWESGDHMTFPKLRWALSNIRQLMPTKAVQRDPSAPVRDLPANLDRMAEIDAITYGRANPPMTWARSLQANYADGVIVLHKGRVVYERYFGVTTPLTQHLVFSITKSLTGIIAASMIHDGKLDENAKAGDLIPELGNSPAGAATVRQLLDMTSGLNDPDLFAGPRAAGFIPFPEDYTGPRSTTAYLRSLPRDVESGTRFAYQQSDAALVGWILRRVTGKSLADLFRERLWAPLGMESDAYFTVDSEGFEAAEGGLCMTLRDLARFGEMIRLKGRFHGRQVVPSAVVEDILRGGDRAKFNASMYAKLLPGWSYRSLWWVRGREDGALSAIGVHGQNLYISPKDEMVVVRLGSHREFLGGGPTIGAYDALARFLNGR